MEGGSYLLPLRVSINGRGKGVATCCLRVVVLMEGGRVWLPAASERLYRWKGEGGNYLLPLRGCIDGRG